MKIWTTTFGCKVNQYETELLRHRLSGPESKVVTDLKEADLCLINTCSVTAFADKEARQMIRRVLRENSRARTIVTGCYATRAPEEIRAISERVEVYTNEEKDQLPSCVGFEISSQPLGIHHFAGRTRAFLKVQDGCKAPCNYCIIPSVRPNMWSKPVEQVLAEAEALLANGYQEIVLTGIRLGLYRGEAVIPAKAGIQVKQAEEWTPASAGVTKKIDLIGLLERLVAIPKNFRIRLSSLEVTEVTDRMIDFVKTNPKLCRHFHIPMQSGESGVLKDMQRWYNAEFYEERIQAVKKAMPDCGVTADVMVGYPTETDDRFETTRALIDRSGLTGLHVFRFSARETTKAAELKPLDPRILQHRAEVLGALDKELRRRFYGEFRGQNREVLPEPTGEGWTDNYLRVEVPLDRVKLGLQAAPVYHPDFEKSFEYLEKTA